MGFGTPGGAGMSFDPIFLGMEAEVFEVMDGPREGTDLCGGFSKHPTIPIAKAELARTT